MERATVQEPSLCNRHNIKLQNLSGVLPSTPSPSVEGGESICFSDARPKTEPATLNELLHNAVIDVKEKKVTVDSEIALSVSYVLVEYGINLTTPLRSLLEDEGYEARADDSLYLKAGDVQVSYDHATMISQWNRDFYF